jgi:hypothetical protein
MRDLTENLTTSSGFFTGPALFRNSAGRLLLFGTELADEFQMLALSPSVRQALWRAPNCSLLGLGCMMTWRAARRWVMQETERLAEILRFDRVRVVGTDQFGTVLFVEDAFALVGFDTGHEITVPIEQLSLAGH